MPSVSASWISGDETRQSPLRGLYPCGEGAGYAGGITSAALDGILSAEAVIRALSEERKEAPHA